MDDEALMRLALDEYFAEDEPGLNQPNSSTSGLVEVDGEWFVQLCDGGFRTFALYRVDSAGLVNKISEVPPEEWPDVIRDPFGDE